MKLEQAARQALKAFETLSGEDRYKTYNAAAALREALAKQAEQEPVAWMDTTGVIHKHKLQRDWQPLYAAPVRTKDLTDDEIIDFEASIDWSDMDWTDRATLEFARTIIAADREKNK